MITLRPEQIKEIAADLSCGLRCFYHKNKKLIFSLPDYEDSYYTKEEIEELMKTEEYNPFDNPDDFIEFEKMDSRHSFSIMEQFAEEMDDEHVQDRLRYAQSRSHPFSKFKDEIEYDGKLRQQWLDFKDKKYVEWVEDQLKYPHNNED
jgi:hypothetical protein